MLARTHVPGNRPDSSRRLHRNDTRSWHTQFDNSTRACQGGHIKKMPPPPSPLIRSLVFSVPRTLSRDGFTGLIMVDVGRQKTNHTSHLSRIINKNIIFTIIYVHNYAQRSPFLARLHIVSGRLRVIICQNRTKEFLAVIEILFKSNANRNMGRLPTDVRPAVRQTETAKGEGRKTNDRMRQRYVELSAD